MRLIAFSIVILSGTILVGLGGVASLGEMQWVGYTMLLLGVVLLAFDLHVSGFLKEIKSEVETWEFLKSVEKRVEKTKEEKIES